MSSNDASSESTSITATSSSSHLPPPSPSAPQTHTTPTSSESSITLLLSGLNQHRETPTSHPGYPMTRKTSNKLSRTASSTLLPMAEQSHAESEVSPSPHTTNHRSSIEYYNAKVEGVGALGNGARAGFSKPNSQALEAQIMHIGGWLGSEGANEVFNR